jgi:hypothetical protein
MKCTNRYFRNVPLIRNTDAEYFIAILNLMSQLWSSCFTTSKPQSFDLLCTGNSPLYTHPCQYIIGNSVIFVYFYPNLFCNKTLHVSGNFFAHHQESRTVLFFVLFCIVTLYNFDTAYKHVVEKVGNHKQGKITAN